MIELKSICAGYSGNNVINNVSLKLPKGKLISVIGANGSGKSTLLKTTVGIIAPSSGEIQVDNIPSADLSRRDIAKRISYLAQGRRVADMTVEQMVLHGRFPHIKYPRRYSEKDRVIAAEALKKWGALFHDLCKHGKWHKIQNGDRAGKSQNDLPPIIAY